MLLYKNLVPEEESIIYHNHLFLKNLIYLYYLIYQQMYQQIFSVEIDLKVSLKAKMSISEI
jgi:hypothetical protein